MDARGSLGGMESHGLMPPERAAEICAAWGVPPVGPDITWESRADAEQQGLAWVDSPQGEGVSDQALAEHLCRELGLDHRSGLRGRGYRCGDLVARLMDYLEQKEQGGEGP